VPEAALLFYRMRLNRKRPKDMAYPKKVTTIGDTIRKRRLELRLRQKDLAKIIGYDKYIIPKASGEALRFHPPNLRSGIKESPYS
jgi:ribosome-binding protein aMBF1 (putative translation factor)